MSDYDPPFVPSLDVARREAVYDAVVASESPCCSAGWCGYYEPELCYALLGRGAAWLARIERREGWTL